MHKTPEHDWHLFDAEYGIEVRQETSEEEDNIWVFRAFNTTHTYAMSDKEFDKLRAGDAEVVRAFRKALGFKEWQ